MAEGNKLEGVSESRSALGDLTNRLGKRGFSGEKSVGIEGFELSAPDNKLKKARISPGLFTEYLKQARIDSLKRKVVLSSVSDENRDSNLDLISKHLADLGGGTGENVVKDSELGVAISGEQVNLVDVTKGSSGVALGSLKVCDTSESKVLGLGGGVSQCVVDVGDGEESGDSFNGAKVGETQGEVNFGNEAGDHNGEGFVLSQSGSIDCFVPASQESTVFGVDKPSEGKKGDVCTNMSGSVDSIKDCSCSFCTKAGHMFMDLKYQDIKARASALVRVQREAIILAERMEKNKTVERHGVESSSKVPSMESDLRQQWKFLFQQMAGIWQKEGNDLEVNLAPVSALRDKLKTKLELQATSSKKN